jgi:drug/metabolite transporter (DMT)-like permease
VNILLSFLYYIVLLITFLQVMVGCIPNLVNVFSTACGFLLWNRGLQMLNASSGGLFFFFQPVVGTLLGWLVLGENIGITFWIGSILILTGVLFVIIEKK